MTEIVVVDETIWDNCPFRHYVPNEILIKKPRNDKVRLVGDRLFVDIPYGKSERCMSVQDFVERIVDPALDRVASQDRSDR